MKEYKRNQRAKMNMLSDDLNYLTGKDRNKIVNAILKVEKRSRESHGKYKSSSDSAS